MARIVTEYPIIKSGKLMIFRDGSYQGLGVQAARASIKQIEASGRDLQPSTQARLALLKDAVALWEAR